jgi:hypothetical protein
VLNCGDRVRQARSSSNTAPNCTVLVLWKGKFAAMFQADLIYTSRFDTQPIGLLGVAVYPSIPVWTFVVRSFGRCFRFLPEPGCAAARDPRGSAINSAFSSGPSNDPDRRIDGYGPAHAPSGPTYSTRKSIVDTVKKSTDTIPHKSDLPSTGTACSC